MIFSLSKPLGSDHAVVDLTDYPLGPLGVAPLVPQGFPKAARGGGGGPPYYSPPVIPAEEVTPIPPARESTSFRT